MQPVRFDHFHPTSTQTMVNYKDTLASYCPANRVTYDLTRMQCISHSLSPLRVRPKLTIKTNSASNVFLLCALPLFLHVENTARRNFFPR